MARAYAYVGPAELRARVGDPAPPVASARDLAALGEPILTFVVTHDGALRVASRRSEHVACAGGQDVLAAGELFISATGAVTGASNLSTGYCPAPACWPALAEALDRAGIAHPPTWTHAFEFRRCDACGERNLIKDDHYACAICDADLSH